MFGNRRKSSGHLRRSSGRSSRIFYEQTSNFFPRRFLTQEGNRPFSTENGRRKFILNGAENQYQQLKDHLLFDNRTKFRSRKRTLKTGKFRDVCMTGGIFSAQFNFNHFEYAAAILGKGLLPWRSARKLSNR